MNKHFHWIGLKFTMGLLLYFQELPWQFCRVNLISYKTISVLHFRAVITWAFSLTNLAMSSNVGTNVWGNTYRLNKEKSSRKLECQPLPAFNTFKTKSSSETQSNIFNLSGTQPSLQAGSTSSFNSMDKRVDWGNIVDNVFREEIGKMAERYKKENK